MVSELNNAGNGYNSGVVLDLEGVGKVIAGIKGGVCQSCGMPIHDTTMFGTDVHGRKTEEYCVQCYQKGVFTDPDIDMFGMIDKSVAWIMNAGVYPEAHIRETISEIIPHLKRWNSPVTTHYFN